MNMLAQAQSVCGTTAGVDEDMVDYINVLRESVLEAYSGIVQVWCGVVWCGVVWCGVVPQSVTLGLTGLGLGWR